MRELRVFVMAMCLVLVPATMLARDAGTIQGRIVDAESGEPLPVVNVVVKGTGFGAATDVNGRYRIHGVPSGEQVVAASMIGYRIAETRVGVVAGETGVADFRLEQTLIGIDAVVVTGTRTPRYVKDAPVRTEVITARAIEEKGAGNVYEVLAGAPGIRVEQQCQFCNFSTVRIQGLGPDHTQVLIDGQPVYSGLASVYGLEQLSTAGIDRIEVVKGAGSALYGSGAIAGGINIVTRQPSSRPEARFGMEMGSYNTNRFDFAVSQRAGRVGIVLFGQKNVGDAIDQTGDGETVAEVHRPDGVSDRVKTDVANGGFRLTVDRVPGNGVISAGGRVVHELRMGGTLDDDLYKNPFSEGTERIITDRYEGNVGYRMRFDPGNEFNFTFAFTRHTRNATNDGFLGDYMATHGDTLPPLDVMRPYLAAENLYAANLNYIQPLGVGNRLLVGVQYSHNDLEESGKYVVVDDEDSLYGEAYTSTSDKRADEIGVYVQDEFRFSRFFEAVAGVRYDFHKSEDNFRGSGKVAPQGVEPVLYDESGFNPRLAVKLTPVRPLTLRASVGTGFRVPYGFSEDLHLCSGSPRVWKGADLKPERSVSYNLGIDYDLDRLSIGANFFRTNLENAIGFVDAGEEATRLGYTYEWRNIDDAWVQGVEVSARLAPMEDLFLDVDFTLNDGQYANRREDWEGTPYWDDSKYISRFPQTTGGLKVEFSPGAWGFVVDADLQGPMYIDYFQDGEEPTRIKRTETHVLLSARVARTLFDRFKVYVGARNLTDYVQPEKHVDDAAFMYAPVYGRVVYGGLKIDL